MSTLMRGIALWLWVLSIRGAVAQPVGPQEWWPTKPRPLPLVHPLFSTNMVLQRDIAVPVWGWSEPGDRLTVSVDGKPAGEAVAGADGRWTTKIGPFPAGGPHTVSIRGSRRSAELENVLFGDVWLCSGQSNMNWPVRLSKNAEAEVKNANYPEIRSFTVHFHPSLVPMKLPPAAKWEPCTPEFARNFTGVGYFFAREIHTKQKIPIGIIHSSVGASAAEAWTSADALRRAMPEDYKERLADHDKTAAAVGADRDYFQELENWVAAADPRSVERKYVSDPDLDTADWIDITVPKPWQEAGLAGFQGLVWFRRRFEVPANWNGKDLALSLSIIKDADIVWLNGKLLGCKQMPGGSRSYFVEAGRVKPGTNLLTAAIVCKAGPGGFCSNPNNMFVRPAVNPGNELVRLGGQWKAKAAVKTEDLKTPMPVPPVGHYKTITGLYNGMIAPLTPFAIKGVLWYQGESNGPFWMLYRRLLPALIADWRSRFEVGDFPFLIVSLANLNAQQTAPVEPGWAELRESQWRTARTVPNTGLAMTVDIGDPKDIHPRDKQEVGRRLALAARKLVYGEKDLIHSGPEFTKFTVEAGKIRLHFQHLGGGLVLKGGVGKATGFAIAGADKKFVWADAALDGDTVVVSSPEVARPEHVRYGWAWNPIVTLFNKEGLPAITFRTDE